MSRYLRGGMLRQRVKRQREIRTSDGAGGSVRTWQDCGQFWAAVRPKGGRERWQAHQIEDSTTHDVLFRAPNATQPNDRLLYGARVFNVRSIIDADERGSAKIALCDEGVAT